MRSVPVSFAILAWTVVMFIALALAASSYVAAASLFSDGPSSARAAASVALAMVGSAVWFLASASLGLLNGWGSLAVALAVTGLATAVVRGRPALGDTAARDLERSAVLIRAALRSPWSLAFVPVAAVALLRGGRAMVSPPMATDALTYHLVRAARWAQTGSYAIEPGPDAWGYVAYYPPSGDGYWALALALGRGLGLGDALLGPLNLVIWLSLSLAAYAVGRVWELPPRRAALVAAAVSVTPAVLAFLGACYVDQLVLASVLLALALLPRGAPGLMLGVACLGLAAAFKATGLPVLGLGLLYAGSLAYKQRAAWTWVGAGALVAVVLVVPNYMAGFLDHENPLYPFSVQLGALALPGNVQNVALHRGAYAPAEVTTFSPGDFARTLTWPRWGTGSQHLNFGPVAWPMAALGVAGLGRALWTGHRRAEALLIGGLVVVFTLRLAGADSLAHRTFLAPAVGRLLLVPLAGLWIMGATAVSTNESSAPWLDAVLALAAVVGAVLAFPRGIASVEIAGTVAAGVWLGSTAAVTLGLIAAGKRLAWRSRTLTALGTTAVSLTLLGANSTWLRPALRYEVWDAGVDAEAFDPHPTDPKAMIAAPLWQFVDREQPQRIAFAAGWDGMGHNWYRYPLFGRRVQNEVRYVPITVDGHVVDYRDPNRALAAGSEVAWLDRLHRGQYTYLLIAAPPRCPEALWARARPHVFEPAGRAGDNRLYRVRQPALAELLTAPVGHR